MNESDWLEFTRSRREEVLNAFTHALGAAAVLAGVFPLLTMAMHSGMEICNAVLIYTISLLSMYLFSSVYHAIDQDRLKQIFRRLDHCSIYLLIAGTYTPILLICGGKNGPVMLFALWGAAVFGITIKCLTIKKFKLLSVILYLLMGWSGVFCMKTLFFTMPSVGLICMFSGGLAYTAGVYFYLRKRPYSHTLWHLFVLAGSSLHFLMIWSLLPRISA